MLILQISRASCSLVEFFCARLGMLLARARACAHGSEHAVNIYVPTVCQVRRITRLGFISSGGWRL